MNNTRERILQTLLVHPRSTINELAEVVGINAISVRHHLASVQAEGLAGVEEERHGVGRPRMVYFLTEKGVEHFPTRYLNLTNRLLDQLKESLPKPTLGKIFAEMATNMAESYAQRIHADLSMEKKLELIKELLAQEGYSMEWEKNGDQYLIREITCPYYHVSQSHPELCSLDQTLFSTLLSTKLQKTRCILQGDAHCQYVIDTPIEEGKKS